MLVFPLSELPEMNRGKGVKLQNYKGKDKLADVTSFAAEDDLVVISGGLPLLEKTAGTNMLKLYRVNRKEGRVLI